MSAPLLMVLATLLFAIMGVAVKYASAHYGAGELVFYRSVIGAVMIGAYTRYSGLPLKTPVPAMHFWRSATGVTALALWFYAIAGLPLGTAMALNYMSSVWMALFLLGGAVWLGASRVDSRLVAAVMVGFAGVAMVLRPDRADRTGLVWPVGPVLRRAGRGGLPADHCAGPRRRARRARGVLLLDRWHRPRCSAGDRHHRLARRTR